MEGYSSSNSDISLDSLETQVKKKSTMKKKVSDDNIDTILVPFYEKDILIKVPKGKKLKDKYDDHKGNNGNETVKNYLVNKEVQKPKRTTYLEIFRKQFPPAQINSRKIKSEIRSISPEFGDTERESFGEEDNNPVNDFFNTESYNEIYYEKLLNEELNNYLEQNHDEQLKFTDGIRSKSPDDFDVNNLRSVSGVSQPRRNIRRASIQPVQNVKLGGLGPDMENIKPRLERARSLQRYSEKVRMENRVKIYKKSVQDEIEKRAEKEVPVRRQDLGKTKDRKYSEKSYLVNKNIQDNYTQNLKKVSNSKLKSANTVLPTRDRIESKEKICINFSQNSETNKQNMKSLGSKVDKEKKNCDKKKSMAKDPDTKQVTVEVPATPVQINFLVNMGGIRPSSALRTLEAKHRMYQEKVKDFTNNNITNNNDKDKTVN